MEVDGFRGNEKYPQSTYPQGARKKKYESRTIRRIPVFTTSSLEEILIVSYPASLHVQAPSLPRRAVVGDCSPRLVKDYHSGPHKDQSRAYSIRADLTLKDMIKISY